MTTTRLVVDPGTVDPTSGDDRRARGARRDSRSVLAFSAPAVLWYAVFTVGPMLAIFVISLLSWRGFLSVPQWAGAANFQRVLGDDVFWTAVRNTGVHLVVSIPVMMPTAFMLGYYLALKPRLHTVLRTILFTPALLSLSVLGTAFYAIFQPTGMLNTLLRQVGLDDLTNAWLADSGTALWAIIAVGLWSGIGFTAVLFSARLGAVPGEVYEAAEIDGCGHWRIMWRIAYPMVREYFGVLTMLQFLWTAFASAGLVLLLTNGGPGNASVTLSFLVYEKAFVQSQVGYSQAVGVILFAVGVVSLLGIRRLFRAAY